MKVDRRSFLGLGLGAAAGVAVSPLTVKLTDDLSIWTQNWPWTPVPVDGEVTYENSVCSLCPGSCGISIRKIKDRPVKIEGRTGYPVNDGGACLHGIAGLQYLYDPARIKSPLKKSGDKFVQISWDEAISEVADKLSEIRNSGTPEKVACILDKDSGSVAGLLKRLIKSYGSPNLFTMPGLESYLELTASTLHGQDMTIGFDLENSDFILSFGAGIIEGWGSPVNCFQANASRKERHAELWQIDSKLSNTAASADRWIAIKPGTQADLAMGMCAFIIKKNLYNASVIDSHEFARFASKVQNSYPIPKVSEITGIPSAVIKEMARAFIKAAMPVAVFGRGRGEGSQSLKELAAIHMLNCLAGNINKKGGTVVRSKSDYLSFPDESIDSIAKQGAAKAPLGKYIHDFFEKVGTGGNPAVEALLVYNANPCYALNNAKFVKQAIGQIPFVVNFSSFMDETAMESDIILPVHTSIERLEDVPSGAGLSKSVVGLSKAIVKPVYDTKHPGDAVILIGQALDASIAGNFEWESYEECLESAAQNIWDELSEEGFVVLTAGASREKVNIDAAFLADNSETVQIKGEGELILIPIDHMRLPADSPSASPFAIKTVSDDIIKGKDSFIEINPQSAKGLKNGDYVLVKTSVGSAKARIKLNEGIMPGVIGMVRGLGHTFGNKYVSGKGSNINELIAPVIEAGSGLDAASGIRASISGV
jgi:menaquinone reductase, molybdopterin-binding-like subunit